MRPAKCLVMITGLPASGKSTLAKAIATSLKLHLLDKDEILEGLYDTLGIGDTNWRRKLSRASDEIFKRIILQSQGQSAVVTSFWRHPNHIDHSGTSTDWLMETEFNIVEIYCKCTPQSAVERFIQRNRHEGHLDNTRDPRELAEQFQAYAELGSIGIGNLIEVDSTKPFAINAILLEIDAILTH